MIVATRLMSLEESNRYFQVLKAARKKDWIYAAISAIILGTGARIGEVLKLRIGDVIDSNGVVRSTIRRQAEKKRGRKVFIDTPFVLPELRNIVQRFTDDPESISFIGTERDFLFVKRWNRRPIVYKTAWTHNQGFLRKAGINTKNEHVAFHGLRKTFATRVFDATKESTGDVWQAVTYVKGLLGHKNISTTADYIECQRTGDEIPVLTSALKNVIGIVQ